jgi:hypothetical protein
MISHAIFPRSRTIVMVAICLISSFLWTGTGRAQEKKQADKWEPFRFLIGTWGTAPDSTGVEGGSGFTFDLQENILMRKNFATYPATADKPAVNHMDLMIIHTNGTLPADAYYWDNEGHQIHYLATISNNSDTLRFTSDRVPGAPCYRLSYTKLGGDSLRVGFEAASPAKPDLFQPYLSGIIHRR